MRLLRQILLLLALAAPGAHAGSALDEAFADAGYARIPATAPPEFSVGGCPLADGHFVLVAIATTPQTRLVVTRLTPEGEPDLAFSVDGQVETGISIPQGLVFLPELLATACQAVGNSDPGDDRLLIAATLSPGRGDNPDSVVWLAKLDLATGALDTQFGQAGQVIHNLTSATPGGRANEQVAGLSPGINGEWLLTGQFLEVFEFEDYTGWVARLSANGQLLRSRALFLDGIHLERATAVRVAGNGNLGLIGHGRVPAGISWIHLELDTDSLAVLGQSVGSVGGLRLHRGRNVGGGAMAVAARIGDAPKAVIVRDSGIRVLDLPPIPTLGGRHFSFGSFTEPAALTGGQNGRFVFAAGLIGLTSIGERAYYVAMGVLGDGAAVADRIEPRFAQGGAASVQRVPADWHCSGRAPLQGFAGIATWGPGHLLLGSIETACNAALARDPLAARLAHDFDSLFKDGFD